MKKTHIIALVFVVMALGAIISTVYNADTYSSFSEARAQAGRDHHIIGTLVRDKNIEETVDDGRLVMRFYMTDSKGEESLVTYYGSKPQDFEKSDQVVLIGRYEGSAFIASSLLLKCPSKYNPDELPVGFETKEVTIVCLFLSE